MSGGGVETSLALGTTKHVGIERSKEKSPDQRATMTWRRRRGWIFESTRKKVKKRKKRVVTLFESGTLNQLEKSQGEKVDGTSKAEQGVY